MVNGYFFTLAQRTAEKANSYEGGGNIKPEWLYAQWVHESRDDREDSPTYGQPFQSQLAQENHNLGGVCQTEPNDSPQPDGDQYYMGFPDFGAYADYFGWYLSQYRGDGIYSAQTVDDYIASLCQGGYFADSLKAYLADVKRIMAENFPEVA